MTEDKPMPIKGQMRFDEAPLNGTSPSAELKTEHYFDAPQAIVFQPLDENREDEGGAEQIINAVLKPKSTLWRKLTLLGVAVLTSSLIFQGIEQVLDAWAQQRWSNLLALTAGGLIIAAGLGTLITEWRRLYRLRERADEREQAQQLLQSDALGNGRVFCEKLAQQAKIDSAHPAYLRWQQALHESHHDKEVVQLYAKLIQPIIDQQIRKEISRYAAESAVMVAISPFTLVDMMFIAWRSFRLINRIASGYGIELGYFSRIRLFRLVLVNIAFAGASELVQEMGVDWLSQDLTARISVRVAQGIGVGLLTARLGIKAMELCRPLPWIENDKPKLTEFRKELLTNLTARFSHKKP